MSNAEQPPVDQSGLATTLAARQQGQTGPTLMDLINKQKGAIERALPKVGVTPERFTRLVTTEIRRNAALASCDPMSVLGSMMYVAQLGLEVGPLGHAYLVPYRGQATFILGYKGIIALAWRSKLLGSIEARTVREGDDFRYAHGLHEELHHIPNPEEARRGAAVSYYAIARYTNGGHYWEVMSKADVEKRRKRSAAAKAGAKSPWDSDYDAMACKSVIRLMAPFLPLSAEFAEALDSDERVRLFDPEADGATRVVDLPDDAEPPVEDAEVGVACVECGQAAFVEGDDPLIEHDGKPYHASCEPRT